MTDTDYTPVKYSRAFWIDLGDRAVSTAAQSVAATLGAGALGILDIDVQAVASVAALATLLAVVKAFTVRAVVK